MQHAWQVICPAAPCTGWRKPTSDLSPALQAHHSFFAPLSYACASSPNFTLISSEIVDGKYRITLQWLRSEGDGQMMRADVFSVLGIIAERATGIEQRSAGDSVHFDVTVEGPEHGEQQFTIDVIGPAARAVAMALDAERDGVSEAHDP
jgi:hypothetical protein